MKTNIAKPKKAAVVSEANIGVNVIQVRTTLLWNGDRILPKVPLKPPVVSHTHSIATRKIKFVKDGTLPLLILPHVPSYNAQFYPVGVIRQRPGDAVDDHHEAIESVVDSLLNGDTRIGREAWINFIESVTAHVLKEDEADRMGLEPEFPRSG